MANPQTQTGHGTTARARIVAAVRGDKVAVDRILRELCDDDNDPIFLLFAEVLEHQGLAKKTIGETVHAAIKKEHEEQRKILHSIYHPRTWKRLLISRVVNWLVMTILFAGALVWSLNRLSTDQLKLVAGVTRDKETIGKFAQALQTSADLARAARENSETLMALGYLLNNPAMKLTREGNDFRISGENLRVENGPTGPSIIVPGDTLKTIIYQNTREDSAK